MGFLEDLQIAATAAQAEETRFRQSFSAEMAARETARAHAFRRLGLMRAMAAAARGASGVEEARAAQQRALTGEIGWDPQADGPARVLAAWIPVADAVWSVLQPPAPTQAPPPSEPSPLAALASFEDWYARTFGRSFLTLLDQEPLEIPVVEG